MVKVKLALIMPILFVLMLTSCQTVEDAPVEQMMTTIDLRKQLEELPSAKDARPIPGCAPAKQMTDILVNTFKEIPTRAGMANDGAIIILFIGKNNTWTLVRVVNGLSCVMDFGVNMQEVKRNKSI